MDDQRIVWTRDIIRCLVESYKSHKCLYTPELLSYKDKNERTKLYEGIKLKLVHTFPGIFVTTIDIQKKIQSLRSQFFRVKKKIDDKTLIYKSRPWFYDLLSFFSHVKKMDGQDDEIESVDVKIEPIDGNQRCRICLMDIVSCLSLNDSVFIEQSALLISDLLNAFTDIKIFIDDKKPQRICQTCADDATSAYLFKLKCERSDAILTNELNNIENVCEKNDMEEIKNEDVEENYDGINQISNVDACIVKSKSIQDIIDKTNNENIENDELNKYIIDSSTNIQDENIEDSNDDLNKYIIAKDDNLLDENFFDENNYLDENIDGIEENFVDNKDALNKNFNGSIDEQTDNNEMQIFNVDGQNVDEILKSHLRDIDKSVDSHICPLCSKTFAYKYGLKAHILRHYKEKNPISSRTCKYCEYEFENALKLGKHMEREHKDMRNIPCTICGKKFSRHKNLRAHIATHANKRNHTCEYCGNNFANSQNLKKHILIHTGEKAFECQKCGKRFTLKTSLYSHNIHVHSDDRNFHCTQCGGMFKRQSTLTAHLKTHTGIKPHKCSICDLRTTTSSSLKKHMLTHTGKADFACDVCGKKFNRKSNMRVHMLSHTGEKRHVCHICGNRFSQAHCLRSHLATQHKNENNS